VISALFTASTIGGPLALLAAGPAFTTLGVREVLAAAAAAQLVAMLVIGVSLLTQWGADAPAGELTTGEA
jgi:hypothetical protein